MNIGLSDPSAPYTRILPIIRMGFSWFENRVFIEPAIGLKTYKRNALYSNEGALATRVTGELTFTLIFD